MRRLTTAALCTIVAAALGLGAAACGSSDDDNGGSGGSKKLAVVHPVVLEGVQQFPLTVMQQQGIAAKHGLKIEPIKVASPEAAYVQYQAPGFQLGLGAWAKAAQMRAAGKDLVNVFPVYGYTNDVVVRPDSPIKSIADLKGKKIGLFGGPGSGTTLLFRLEAVKYFGFDPVKDAKVFYGAAPLMLGQLQKGQLDAALLLDPLITNLLTAHKVRSIGNLGDVWRAKTGQSPVLVTITMNGQWARKNADTAKRFVAAFDEAQQYIKTHDDVWKGLAASVGIKTPQGVALLRKRVSPQLLTTWNAKVISEQQAFARELTAAFGKTKDFPSSIPQGTFTTDTVPAGAS